MNLVAAINLDFRRFASAWAMNVGERFLDDAEHYEPDFARVALKALRNLQLDIDAAAFDQPFDTPSGRSAKTLSSSIGVISRQEVVRISWRIWRTSSRLLVMSAVSLSLRVTCHIRDVTVLDVTVIRRDCGKALGGKGYSAVGGYGVQKRRVIRTMGRPMQKKWMTKPMTVNLRLKWGKPMRERGRTTYCIAK